MEYKRLASLLFAISVSASVLAVEDRVELDTTIIKGNTELPKILYVVPWKDLDGKVNRQQKLRLHSLFGDMFEPVTPPSPEAIKTGQHRAKD